MEIQFNGENQNWYNIAGAIRGPDCNKSFARIIKEYTNARIRSITGIYGDKACIVNPRSIIDSECEFVVRHAKALLKKPPWWDHWNMHTQLGLVAAGNIFSDYKSETDKIVNMLRSIDNIFREKEK